MNRYLIHAALSELIASTQERRPYNKANLPALTMAVRRLERTFEDKRRIHMYWPTQRRDPAP